MSSPMTWTTKSYSIIYLISQIRMRTPRFYMMHMKFNFSYIAFLASIVVSFKDTYSKINIFGFFVFSWSKQRMPTFPVWMIFANKMSIPWWGQSNPKNALFDGFFVLFREYPTSICFGDTFCSFFTSCLGHHVKLIVVFLGNLREFLFYIWTLGDIAMKISPCNATRISTKPLTSASVFFVTLLTSIFIKLCHNG